MSGTKQPHDHDHDHDHGKEGEAEHDHDHSHEHGTHKDHPHVHGPGCGHKAVAARRQARRVRAHVPVCGEACKVEVVHAEAVRAARSALPSAPQAERLVALFGAFANATRLALLVALRSAVGAPQPELCVCDLVVVTGASQSMVSHQLTALRELGLVIARREGRLIYYRLADAALARLVDEALGCVSREKQ